MDYNLWLEEGIEDFQRAKKLIELNDIKAAYFFLQQAVEKILKALLLKKSIFIKSHDISLLYDYISKEYNIFNKKLSKEEIDTLKSLTIHYSASRYPNARIRFRIPKEFYSDVDRARRVLSIVEKVVKLANDVVKRDPKFGVDERGINIDEVISRYIKRIKKLLPISCVIVFGSRARGDWKSWSDIDLVIIVREITIKNYEELFKVLHEPLVEYRLYTINEALESLEKGDPTLLLALFEGIVVYDDGTYSRLKEIFNKLWEIKVLTPGIAYRFTKISE